MCRNVRAGLLNPSESFSSISSVPKVPRVPKARTFHKVQQSTPHKTCLGTLKRTEKPDIFEILRDLLTSLMCRSQYFRNNRRQRVSRIPTPSIMAGALASLFGRSLRASQTVHPVRPPPAPNDDGFTNDEVRRASFDSDPFPRGRSFFGPSSLSSSIPSVRSLGNLRESRRERREKRRKANALVEGFSSW